MRLQPAVKKETIFTAAATLAGAVVMLLVFFILHVLFPQWAPFDHTVFIGAAGGCVVAVLNFLLMAVTVQKITALDQTDDDRARHMMTVSLRYRLLMQLIWVILAIVLGFINMVSGIVPLFIPSAAIKLRGVFSGSRK